MFFRYIQLFFLKIFFLLYMLLSVFPCQFLLRSFLYSLFLSFYHFLSFFFVKSAGAVKYTDCTSSEGYDPPNQCPEYDTKQSDGEVPVMLENWGIRSTPSLPSLPRSLWPEVVDPDKTLSMD